MSVLKKQSVILLAVLMIMTMVACSGNNGETASPAPGVSASPNASTSISPAPSGENKPVDTEKYGTLALPETYTPVSGEDTQDAYIQYENKDKNVVVTVVQVDNKDISLDNFIAVFKAPLDEAAASSSVLSDAMVDGKPAKLLEVITGEGTMTSTYFIKDDAGIRYIQVEHPSDDKASRNEVIANYKL